MKIAILSDIHGNYVALQEVLKEIERLKIEHLFFLGDQLGYYYQAEEVYTILNKFSHDIISGNHERLYLKYLKSNALVQEELTKKYGTCFEFYKNTFPSELEKKVRSLPEQLKVKKKGLTFVLCHGAISDKDDYVYPDAEMQELLKNDIKGVDYIFNGHTHYPMLFRGKHSTFINVGSVGQSRTVGGIANWGVFNTDNRVYSPQNTLYDIKKVTLNLKQNKAINKYLFDILKRNNFKK